MERLPFSWTDLRAALPPACLRPSLPRSLGHLALDLCLLAALYAVSARAEAWWLLPPLWVAQGTLFWALFLIGHDCGHGAFSRIRWLDTWVGHLAHTPLLVPYHAWRISHRLHHRHIGDIERDETWFPLTRAQVEALPAAVRWLRFRMFLLILPFYLLRRTPERRGSHFDPRSELFAPHERRAVAVSVAACAAFAAGLVAAAFALGPGWVARHWLAPYVVFVVWLDLVTYLHHTDPAVPWYRGPAWSRLAGALSTVDRHYGVFEPIHHHVGSHVAHHLFPQIPHYRLREATAALRPVLGSHYRVSAQPIWRALLEAARRCHVVPEEGGVVYYEPASAAGSRPATR